MIDITREQVGQLNTWFEQRDAILRAITLATSEFEIVTKKNKELSESNTDLETRITANGARVKVLEDQEKEKELLCSHRIATLLARETELIAVIGGLQTSVTALAGRKGDLESMIKTLEDLHDKVFDKVGVLGQVVDHVKRVGQENTDKANYLISNVKDVAEGAISTLTDLNTNAKKKADDLDKSVDRAINFLSENLPDINKVATNQGKLLG